MPGKKNADKVVRKVNKGQSSDKKIAAIHKMVESLISGKSDDAADHLHDYLQMKSRDLIIGESKDEDDDDDKEMVAKSQDDDDDDDDDDDEEVDEGFAQPSEGAMSKKTGKFPTGGKKKGGLEKHGNAAPGLDDKIKGKAKYQRYPKGKPAETHANVKDDYDKKCDGRDKNLGTTD